MNIQWYPGHMKKTRDLISTHIKLVDFVVELLDARAPLASRNPLFDDLLGDKKRLLLLNKADLAEERVNQQWIHYFEKEGHDVLLMNAKDGSTVKMLDKLQQMGEPLQQKLIKQGRKARSLRIMILGVPNVGKSSLINRLVGRSSAKTGDRPGVTRGKQWVRLRGDLELFDTPGILWPKFDDQEQALYLALLGSIRDEILDLGDLAYRLIGILKEYYPGLLQKRYGVEEEGEIIEIMDAIALSRGALLPGKRIDYDRVSRLLLDEFRGGILGRISLEQPEHEGVEEAL